MEIKNIYDINIQLQELDKGMIIANTLKGNLNSKQLTNSSWLITSIKAIPKTPIQKSEKPIFSFTRTHEAAARNSKIIAAFKDDLGAEIVVQKDRPVKYGPELRDIASLAKLFLHHEDKTKIINIIKQGYRYHFDPIEEEKKTKIIFRRNDTQGKP